MAASSLKKMLKLFITFAVILLTFTACAVKPTDSYQANSFNPKTINGGLAIMGVVSSYKKNSISYYYSWAKTLEASVSKHRKIPLITAKSVKKKLKGNYSFILNNYQETNKLNATELKLIRHAGLIAKYGLFASIDRNIQNKLTEQVYGVRDVNGYMMRDRSRVVLETERIVRVSAKVFDLTTGKVVWQTTREIAPKRKAEFIAYNGKSFSNELTIATVNTLSNGVYESRQPRAPDFEYTLGIVLDDIAKQLPTVEY